VLEKQIAQIYAGYFWDYLPQIAQIYAELTRAIPGRKNTSPKLIYAYPEICTVRLRWGFDRLVFGIKQYRNSV
jgi:hypothetical protein